MTAGWCLTEFGRQPWIVQGLLKTANANSPSVSTTWLGIGLTVFVLLYVFLFVLDIWLMRRYAAATWTATRCGDAGGGVLTMDLQTFWFVLIAVLWGGYFLLEGFDFGVGLLLPFLPGDDDSDRRCSQSIGPVWDGNEVWLVVAGGATFAAFPTWYATMFSGFYIALLLVLVCLIVRVSLVRVARKGREPALAVGLDVGELRSAASARRSSGASLSPTSSTASRSTRTATSRAISATCSAATRWSPASPSCSCSRSTARRT